MFAGSSMGRNKKRRRDKNQHGRCFDNSNHEHDFSPEIHAEIAAVFSKKFTYSCEDRNTWTLPPVDRIFHKDHNNREQWEDPTLQELKENLNTVKSKLSDLDITHWHTHTQNMNRAGDVMNHIKRRVELCTQAWCKFYEVVNSYPIVPLESPYFSSLHICEAPGAFITSLNHYLVTAGT